MSNSELHWFGDYGYLKVSPSDVYDQAYFDKYVGYSKTKLGIALTKARVGLVRTYIEDSVHLVDVGIGCGQFVEARPGTSGYDVNPAGVKWLVERRLFVDPHHVHPQALSFWDSLEHLPSPSILLERCTDWIFVSIPVFRNKEHARTSKHYRPDEHFWYFTGAGLVRLLKTLDFDLVEENDVETKLGRDGIQTYVFRKR